ncbi:MAG: transferase hexapeptide repeat containing protein [Acidobacteriota bacterium]
MHTETQIEQRLRAVEDAVSELQRNSFVLPPASDWLERISGSFKDDPAFEQVLEYGRQMRHADRPPDEPEKEAETQR